MNHHWAPQDLPVTDKQKDLHYAFNPNDFIPGGMGVIFDYVWHWRQGLPDGS